MVANNPTSKKPAIERIKSQSKSKDVKTLTTQNKMNMVTKPKSKLPSKGGQKEITKPNQTPKTPTAKKDGTKKDEKPNSTAAPAKKAKK
ncbi:hypothetical protein M8J77_012153 [Diaphorina citri]|nr:hypothetical protein M8J77_012153 [Diaphorina citri]